MPEVQNPQAVVLQWYDRSQLIKVFSGNFDVGPHVGTVRWTYTVPANRKAWVSLSALGCYRTVVAGAAGNANNWYRLQPNGGGAVIVSLVPLFTVTQGLSVFAAPPPVFLMSAGDILTQETIDPSTGGQIFHIGGAYVNEFIA